jgi:hypothetical protein
MDMRLGTFNMRILYSAGSLMTVLKELFKYKLDSVVVQEIRWKKGFIDSKENTHFLWKLK